MGEIRPILSLTFIIHCAVENMQKKQFSEKQMQQCNSTAIGNDCNCLLLKIEVIYNTTNCLVCMEGALVGTGVRMSGHQHGHKARLVNRYMQKSNLQMRHAMHQGVDPCSSVVTLLIPSV